jgi:hypothetical protein
MPVPANGSWPRGRQKAERDHTRPGPAHGQDNPVVFNQRRASVAEADTAGVVFAHDVDRPSVVAGGGIEASNRPVRRAVVDATLVPGRRRVRSGVGARGLPGRVDTSLPNGRTGSRIQADDTLARRDRLQLRIRAVANDYETREALPQVALPEQRRATLGPLVGESRFRRDSVIMRAAEVRPIASRAGLHSERHACEYARDRRRPIHVGFLDV